MDDVEAVTHETVDKSRTARHGSKIVNAGEASLRLRSWGQSPVPTFQPSKVPSFE